MTDTAENARTTLDRLRERKEGRPAAPPAGEMTFLLNLRGYLDALVIAFLLAMFIRSFVFELFVIPTGSMTPTLIGDQESEVAFDDYDGDKVDDVIYTAKYSNRGMGANDLQIFLMNADGTYKDLIFLENGDSAAIDRLKKSTLARKDMIIVNKFAYWFATPDRGEIAVFKVPYRKRNTQWEIDKPVFIKRVVGLPGEEVTFRRAGEVGYEVGNEERYSNRYGGTEVHLAPQPVLVDGKTIEGNSLANLIHFSRHTRRDRDLSPDVEKVPEDGVLMIGDNSFSSSDGRYWGHVPLNHLRGKAVFRYWPIKGFGFLDKNRESKMEKAE